MVSESAFEKWFVEQHGGKREGTFWPQSDNDLRNIEIQGDAARRELDRRREWDVRKESALYAWQARERV